MTGGPFNLGGNRRLLLCPPYAYIVGAGSGEMPLLAWIIIGLLVTFFGVASVIRIVRQIRRRLQRIRAFVTSPGLAAMIVTPVG